MVGSTLSLTGALAATGVIHQIVGEMFVERLNENGGLLGRPVEWRLLDDESDQAQITPLYERLINQEEVDLIIGPYATPNIIAGGGRSRAGRVHHPAAHRRARAAADLRMPVPGLVDGPAAGRVHLRAAVRHARQPARAAADDRAGDQRERVHRADDPRLRGGPAGGMLALAEQYGLEVVADIPYAPGNQEWNPVAVQLRDADPDVVINNGLGVDPVGILEASEQIGYRPPMLFSLFPAPGPLLGLGELGEGTLSVSLFESNEPLLEQYGDEAREIVEEFRRVPRRPTCPTPRSRPRPPRRGTAWEILVGAVEGAGSLDQKEMCDYLHENGADTTFSGHLTFDPAANNFWPTNVGHQADPER